MTREQYESLSAAQLKSIAKTRGLKVSSGMRKSEVVNLMLEEDEKTAQTEKTVQKDETSEKQADKVAENSTYQEGTAEKIEKKDDKPSIDMAQLDSGIRVSGILEVMPDGYGFIRSNHYLPGENDVYVSPSQIRKFSLKTGDIIEGNTRIKTAQEKFSALLYLTGINGMAPSEAVKRYNFEDMTPIFPNQRLRVERGSKEVSM